MNFSNFFLATLMLLTSLSVFAHESAGGRGGGTGVLCEGRPLVMIEQYELERDSIEDKLPANRGAIRRLMKAKLKMYPELFIAWEYSWLKNGKFKDWKIRNAENYADYLNQKANDVRITDIMFG